MDVKIGPATEMNPDDYIGFYSIEIVIDGVPSSFLVAKQRTDIGINVLVGHDILRFLGSTRNLHAEVGKVIAGDVRRD
jgi:hypothetical protein